MLVTESLTRCERRWGLHGRDVGLIAALMTNVRRFLQVIATVASLAVSCAAEGAKAEPARSSKDFIASAGVNTHLGYSDTVYWQDWPMIRQRLRELGVSHVRDGTFAAAYPDVIGPTVAARYNELNAAGIKGNLLVGLEQAHNGISLDTRLRWIKANVLGFTTSIEGSNESWDDATAIRKLQCDIYQHAKSDPALASRPVIGPSNGPPFSETEWYDRVGDLSSCLDKGNLHPYPGGQAPHLHQDRDLSVAMEWGRRTYGSAPYWVTETGYWNTLSDYNGVSEAAAGVYVPRSFLESFRRGIERTQAYELIDLNTASDRVIDRYGLLRTDGTRKPAFTGLGNLLAIVRDREQASGSLGFTINCTSNCRADDPVRHVLLRHSDGSYFIAFWGESEVWNRDTKSDTPEPGQGIDVRLDEAPAKVELYNPASGRTPFRTDTSRSRTVSTHATDHVQLLRVRPG